MKYHLDIPKKSEDSQKKKSEGKGNKIRRGNKARPNGNNRNKPVSWTKQIWSPGQSPYSVKAHLRSIQSWSKPTE
jgi:hypothetical protein